MILSIKRTRNYWPNILIGVAVLVAVAYVFHEAGAQGVEPVPPKVVSVPVPIVARPGPNAEPELIPMNEPASPVAQAQAPAVPVREPVAPPPPPEQEVPPQTTAVTAMMKRSHACTYARVGGAEEAIQRIVAREGTISTAQMEALRAFEARCLSE